MDSRLRDVRRCSCVSGHLDPVCNWLLFGWPLYNSVASIIYVIRLSLKKKQSAVGSHLHQIMIQQLKSTLPDEVAARHIWCLLVMLPFSPNYDSTIKCCVIFNFLDEVFIKHRPIAHPKYISHDFRRIRCYPRSTPTFFIPIRSHIAWLWLATAPCPFYIVKATIVLPSHVTGPANSSLL